MRDVEVLLLADVCSFGFDVSFDFNFFGSGLFLDGVRSPIKLFPRLDIRVVLAGKYRARIKYHAGSNSVRLLCL